MANCFSTNCVSCRPSQQSSILNLVETHIDSNAGVPTAEPLVIHVGRQINEASTRKARHRHPGPAEGWAPFNVIPLNTDSRLSQNHPHNSTTNVPSLVQQAVSMATELLRLCDAPIKDNDAKTLSMTRDFPLLKRQAPSDLIIPLQESLTVNLPATSCQNSDHQPFPPDAPKFYRSCCASRLYFNIED